MIVLALGPLRRVLGLSWRRLRAFLWGVLTGPGAAKSAGKEPEAGMHARGCAQRAFLETRARPKRYLAWFWVSFCFPFWQRGAGEQAEQNEQQNENKTENAV